LFLLLLRAGLLAGGLRQLLRVRLGVRLLGVRRLDAFT
jgi:hypothetical protein